jgi:hypothetical protein
MPLLFLVYQSIKPWGLRLSLQHSTGVFLTLAKIGDGRLQRCATTCLMSFVGDPDAIDGVMRIAFDDRAMAMQRAGGLIPDPCQRDAPDREMSGGDARHCAAVTGGIVQTDDFAHGFSKKVSIGFTASWCE